MLQRNWPHVLQLLSTAECCRQVQLRVSSKSKAGLKSSLAQSMSKKGETGGNMSGKGETGDVDSGAHGMRMLWKDMAKQTRAKTRRSRSQPGKFLSANHVLISTTSNSSSFGSTHSSSTAVSNSDDDLGMEGIGMEGQAAAPRTSPISGPVSASSSSYPSGGTHEGESSAYPYVVPPGFVIRNTFLEPQDMHDEFFDEPPAPARLAMLEFEAARLRKSLQSQRQDAPDGSPEEESAEVPVRLATASAAASEPQASAAAADPEAGASTKKGKRPRPPKPKRELAKRIAENFFQAQMLGSDEDRERAEQVFLQETSSDLKLYEYAQNVLRRLNVQARDREARGEDPLLTMHMSFE